MIVRECNSTYLSVYLAVARDTISGRFRSIMTKLQLCGIMHVVESSFPFQKLLPMCISTPAEQNTSEGSVAQARLILSDDLLVEQASVRSSLAFDQIGEEAHSPDKRWQDQSPDDFRFSFVRSI